MDRRRRPHAPPSVAGRPEGPLRAGLPARRAPGRPPADRQSQAMVARRHRTRVQQAPPHVPGRMDPITPRGTKAHPPVRTLAVRLAHQPRDAKLLRVQLPRR